MKQQSLTAKAGGDADSSSSSSSGFSHQKTTRKAIVSSSSDEQDGLPTFNYNSTFNEFETTYHLDKLLKYLKNWQLDDAIEYSSGLAESFTRCPIKVNEELPSSLETIPIDEEAQKLLHESSPNLYEKYKCAKMPKGSNCISSAILVGTFGSCPVAGSVVYSEMRLRIATHILQNWDHFSSLLKTTEWGKRYTSVNYLLQDILNKKSAMSPIAIQALGEILKVSVDSTFPHIPQKSSKEDSETYTAIFNKKATKCIRIFWCSTKNRAYTFSNKNSYFNHCVALIPKQLRKEQRHDEEEDEDAFEIPDLRYTSEELDEIYEAKRDQREERKARERSSIFSKLSKKSTNIKKIIKDRKMCTDCHTKIAFSYCKNKECKKKGIVICDYCEITHCETPPKKDHETSDLEIGRIVRKDKTLQNNLEDIRKNKDTRFEKRVKQMQALKEKWVKEKDAEDIEPGIGKTAKNPGQGKKVGRGKGDREEEELLARTLAESEKELNQEQQSAEEETNMSVNDDRDSVIADPGNQESQPVSSVATGGNQITGLQPEAYVRRGLPFVNFGKGHLEQNTCYISGNMSYLMAWVGLLASGVGHKFCANFAHI